MSKKNRKKKNKGGAFGASRSCVPSHMDWDNVEKELRGQVEQYGFEMSPIVPLSDLIECHEKRN